MWQAIGAIAGGAASAYESWRKMDDQQGWQEHMASSQHQREVADLRAAGLNPILSAKFGGSGVPGGGISGTSDHASSALQYFRQKAEIDLLRSQEKKVAAETQATQATIPGIYEVNSAHAADARLKWYSIPRGRTQSGLFSDLEAGITTAKKWAKDVGSEIAYQLPTQYDWKRGLEQRFNSAKSFFKELFSRKEKNEK